MTAGASRTDGDAAALTVRDVLGLDLVAAYGPEVVAGAVNLDRPVRWMHVAEAIDVAVMLTGGEIVLTTGLLLADERDQAEYIEAMHRADVAAVVLGLGRAFRTTPPVLRRTAERRGIPLIVMHRPTPFARLTEEVHSRLVHGRFAELDLSDRVRSGLGALNLAGASLQQLLDEVAVHAGCPVVMENLAHRVLATAGDKGALGELQRDWERVSRQASSLAGGSTAASGPDGWIVAPLEARGQRWGRLVLFGYRGVPEAGCVLADRAAEALAMHRLLGDRDRSWESQAAEALLADLASGAVRSDQLLTRARAAGLPVNRRVFVPLVIRLPEGPDAHVLEYAGGHGSGLGSGHAPGHASQATGGPAPSTEALAVASEDVPELIGRLLAEDSLAGLVARVGTGGVGVLLSLPRDQRAETVVNRLAVRVRDVLSGRGSGHGQAHGQGHGQSQGQGHGPGLTPGQAPARGQSPGQNPARPAAPGQAPRVIGAGPVIVIGAGAECAALDEVPRAFAEAVHVADAAVADPPAGPVARLRDVRLRGLVRLLRDVPELQAFIERELGPLFEHPELLDVLRTYLRTGRNKSLAAQAQHVSRPAIYRRLRRVEELLGIDLEDWDQLTSLYVALLAYEAQRASDRR